MKQKPIKRDIALQAISREHHFGLLLCWKIRTGFAKKVSPDRIKQYVNWFYKNHIIDHFKVEEEYIFPILGNDSDYIKSALADHRRLKRLFTGDKDLEKSLSNLEEELEQHIRFEERVVFNEIQKIATKEQLSVIRNLHTDEKFIDNTADEFWK
ncbi:hemerythrin domain-containing protein [Cellulophaga sp. F20128]|uniref:hemerythrin domain-containing protein n=1 Tax=Cellulophaga sp. F20128 TaxID=2926413 RepID=UPI001FF115CE|nr:hemerythrin domain-containing protein [Cellulophaga sp. F20128]MCK0156130.1 hemerythrin domain-containing protein [Cellulophaga sp. F20128]